MRPTHTKYCHGHNVELLEGEEVATYDVFSSPQIVTVLHSEANYRYPVLVGTQNFELNLSQVANFPASLLRYAWLFQSTCEPSTWRNIIDRYDVKLKGQQIIIHDRNLGIVSNVYGAAIITPYCKAYFVDGHEYDEETFYCNYYKGTRAVKQTQKSNIQSTQQTTEQAPLPVIHKPTEIITKKVNRKMDMTKCATRASARVISQSVSLAIKDSLVQLLDNLAPEEILIVRKFLDSSVGELIISGLIGYGMPNLPMIPENVKDNEYFQLVSEEFVVNAFTIGESQLLAKTALLVNTLLNPILNALAKIPVNNIKEIKDFRDALNNIKDGGLAEVEKK